MPCKKGPWEIKKAIYILRVFLYTSWLLNTAPVVHPSEAKQHQFTGCWFHMVALLFARTKIEHAISQHYNLVENICFEMLVLHQTKEMFSFLKLRLK